MHRLRTTYYIPDAKNLILHNPRSNEARMLIVRKDGSKHWVLFDSEDIGLVKGYRWCFNEKRNVVICKMNGSMTPFHRLLLGFPKGLIDHKNHNPLDNRKSKLRICNGQQNSRNRMGKTKKNTSGFIGVRWHQQSKAWQSYLNIKGKFFSLGHYEIKKCAAIARDIAASLIDPDFYSLNFPELKHSPKLIARISKAKRSAHRGNNIPFQSILKRLQNDQDS